MNENLNCGIYQIRNVVNDKCYIGQSINLKARKNKHWNELKKNVHRNGKLQNAYNKYGVNSFEFEILLHCDKEDLTLYEQMFVDEFDPFYNIKKECVKSSLGVKCSEESKQKISVGVKRSFIGRKSNFEGVPAWNKGVPWDKEIKRKISDKLKGKHLTNETKEKLKGRIPWNKGKSGYSTSKKGKKYPKRLSEDV